MGKRFLGLAIAVVFCELLTAAAPAQAADEYTVDGVHSGVTFKISHLGVAWIFGRFDDFSGKFTIDGDDAAKCSFTLTIKPESIDTNNSKRDEHLKSPDFFNAAQFGTLTFKSTSFKKVDDKNFQVTGDLTFHGVTKSVTLNATFNGTTVNPMSKKTVAGFKVTGTIKRTDFGIGANFPTAMLSDEVALDANTEFVKG